MSRGPLAVRLRAAAKNEKTRGPQERSATDGMGVQLPGRGLVHATRSAWAKLSSEVKGAGIQLQPSITLFLL